MATRVTEVPIEHSFQRTETAPNTYSEFDIQLPVAILAGGRLQGIELMKIRYEISEPDLESGQSNETAVQLVRDSKLNTGLIGHTDDDLIWKKRITNRSDTQTQGQAALQIVQPQEDRFTFMNEGTEIGQFIVERTIHMGIKGSGNVGTKGTQGFLYYHLVELTASEVIVQLALDDDI